LNLDGTLEVNVSTVTKASTSFDLASANCITGIPPSLSPSFPPRFHFLSLGQFKEIKVIDAKSSCKSATVIQEATDGKSNRLIVLVSLGDMCSSACSLFHPLSFNETIRTYIKIGLPLFFLSLLRL